jgi:hypothetical protein
MTDLTLDDPSPRPSYAARAFTVQYNLILLGGSALFSLALASLVPLAAGAIGELVWLLVGSNLGPVRRWLDQRAAPAEEPAPEEVEPPAAPTLERVYRHRLNILDQAFNELRSLGHARSDAAFRASLGQLPVLRRAFEATCHAHQGVQRFLDATPLAELAGELEHLQQALGAEQDLVAKMGIRQSLVLAKRRIEQRQGKQTELNTLSLRLETVERAVAHLIRQGRSLGGNAELARELDALATQFTAATPL